MKKTEVKKYFCATCGEELSSDDLFCPSCGAKVTIHKEEKENSKEEKQEEPKVNWSSKSFDDVKEVETERIPKDGSKKTKPEKPKKNHSFLYPVLASVLTFVICLVCFGLFYQFYLKNLVIETTREEVTVTDTGIADAVEKVYDSVVVVESFVNDRLYATGTGFVYKEDNNKGYILTNAHVIEGATEIKVVFTNEEEVTVDLVGSDTYSDVAVLSVDQSKVISVAEIGSSEDLRVGDTAFAVGAPIDSSSYAWTVTRGIISGKNRLVEVSATSTSAGYIAEVLQTDAAINEGNSGGPLCNSNGQVIGITNLKLASESIEGMGFAIPIETAVSYADKFIAGEPLQRPYLGITIVDGSSSFFGYTTGSTGVYVNSVDEGSPAANAGMKQGDQIVAVGDNEVSDTTHFRYELYKYSVGDTVSITVRRNGREQTLSVTLTSSGENA